MEEAGTQVAPPIFIHQQTLSSRFSMAKKRDLPNFQEQAQRLMAPTPGLQYPVRDTWNRKGWDWDNVGFVAKPVDLMLGTPTTAATVAAEQSRRENYMGVSGDEEEDERLRLNLGGGLKSVDDEPEPEPEPEPASRPNKRVRSGSPGGGNYPMCQVDNCKEDLSNAKDYHRRHKVCEVHSKSGKALVANQMQRFCQQCSRFHPLSEFDEGKRSCRRRLAGHNRRRRKTQGKLKNHISFIILIINNENSGMAEQFQHTSAQDHQQLVVLKRARGYDLGRETRDSRIWHHLIFCEELENNDLQNGAFCWLCEKRVLRGTPAYKCLECYFLQHKSCVDQPHGLHIEGDHVVGAWERHHLIFIEEDLQDKGGEEKKFVCSGCKEPTTIGRDPAYKCSMPGCTFLLHKSCGELPTLIKHRLHDSGPDLDLDLDSYLDLHLDPDLDLDDHILILREPSTGHYYCSFCLNDFRGSWFYRCKVCLFYLHATCALLSTVNPDDCHQHKLSPSWKKVQFTCQSCGEETKDFAYVCSECRVLIHGKCAQFQHTIKTKTHDHSLTRTYSSLSHQLDIFCKLCYKKLNTEHAAYYCCRECGYVVHLDCANKVRDFRPPNEWMPINSVDYQTHLVHLVEGINLAYDERVSLPEIRHFSHPQHNLILNNEEPIDDMRCEACMQFIISTAPFYGCTQCKFFLHDRCSRLPRTIQRGIFHEHSLTLLSQARDKNGLFECEACKRYRHGFVYNCGNCGYHLDVQCCLIPETLKHKGHQHYLFLARRSSETCNACGKDCEDDDLRLVCTNSNFTLCIRCATLPLVAKCQYDTDLLKLSYTREDDPEDYYCVICEEERNHPDRWFYYGVKNKFTAHSRCVLGDNPCIKFESTYKSNRHRGHPLTFVQKTHHSSPCDLCRKPFYGVALKCTKWKFNIHTPFSDNGSECWFESRRFSMPPNYCFRVVRSEKMKKSVLDSFR